MPQLAARHLARHDDPARRTRCILLTITRRRWKALPDAERHRFEQRVALLERSAWAPASAPSFESHHQANRLEHPQLPHATRAHATVFWFGYNSSAEEASRAPKPSAAVAVNIAVPMSNPAPALSRTAAPVSSVNLTAPVATPPEPPTKGWLRAPEPPHEQNLAWSGPAVKPELGPPNPTAPPRTTDSSKTIRFKNNSFDDFFRF